MTQNERDFRTIIIVCLAMAFAIALGLFSTTFAHAVPPKHPATAIVQPDGAHCWIIDGYLECLYPKPDPE